MKVNKNKKYIRYIHKNEKKAINKKESKKINENKAQSTKEATPYFPGRAEALLPLWSDNLVAVSGLCGVWGWPMVLIVRCTSA